MWYYAKDSEQCGPVEKDTLVDMINNGELPLDTLVWTNNMRNWQPATEVADLVDELHLKAAPLSAISIEPEQPAVNSTEEIPLDDNASNSTANQESFQDHSDDDLLELKDSDIKTGEQSAHTEDTYSCSMCGKRWPLKDLVSYNGKFYCPNCQCTLYSNLQEKKQQATDHFNLTEYQPASLFSRFIADLIDTLIMCVILFPLQAGLIYIAANAQDFSDSGTAFISPLTSMFGKTLFFAINVVIQGYFLSSFGATPGKMLMRIRVIYRGSDDGKMSFCRGALRGLGEWLSSSLCWIGYIIAFFSQEKRALHDYICDTIVVDK